MSFLKLIVAAIVSLALGVALGAIPFLNLFLHFSIWLFVPVGGLVLGAVFGAVQVFVARVLQAKIGLIGGLFLTICGALAYVATDAGYWLTKSIDTQAGQSVPLRDVVALPDFMVMRLTRSTLLVKSHSIHMGEAATIATFVVDELGALLGTATLVFCLGFLASYCARCSRYRKDLVKVEREYPLDEAQATGFWQSLKQLADGGHYAHLAAQVQGLPGLTVASRRKLEAQETGCPKCGEVALEISLFRPGKDGWSASGERLTSEGGAAHRASLVA